MKMCFLVLALCFPSTAPLLFAGSATWKSDPASSDWNTPANWRPATVPDGPSDVATFGTSSQTLVEIPTATEVDSIVFDAGADPFTIVQEYSDSSENRFTFSGAGIVNNSGVLQNFAASASGGRTYFFFYNTASAGVLTRFRLETSDIGIGEIDFYNSSSAGSTTIINQGGGSIAGGGSATWFFDTSTAGNAAITANGAPRSDAGAGFIIFASSSTADHALLMANGTPVSGTYGGSITFSDFTNAEEGTIVATGSLAGNSSDEVGNVDARAGSVSFAGSSSGGTARLKLLGNAFMDLSSHTPLGMQIGSIEGEGSVFMRRNLLVVGTNNLSTTFSGRILQNGQPRIGGAIEKVGTGTWTLSGANTYNSGTTVTEGFFRVSNTTGSATGSGAVQVNGGTLGGAGIVSGPVTVGTGSGPGAFLAPGSGATTITLQSSLTFEIDGTYVWRFTTRSAKADKVIANGVTIESGAKFDPVAKGNTQLAVGTTFVVISNTAATPISGAFSNLIDGSFVTFGRNKFRVSYQGGDGNDLTLTVLA